MQNKFNTENPHFVPTWNENGTQLSQLQWAVNKKITENQIKLVPSFDQKCTHLLSKKACYLISILLLCAEPLKMSQILHFLQYKNEKFFRDNYLKPLRNAGLIEMLYPENPTDPENKYFLTSEGMQFVSKNKKRE